jgi:hypothetical protein
MINVCIQCGLYRADKIIDPNGPVAICPECSFRHKFVQLPLLIVSGASGAGKSTVCHALLGRLNNVVILDADILWRPEFNQPENNYRAFFEIWLRMCKNIAQSGRPVVLFGAGAGVPDNIEPCVERRYFSRVAYLALVCDDNALAERLQSRPQWRGCNDPAYIADHQNFNRWFKTYASTQPPIDRLDTTGLDEEATANWVEGWINKSIKNSQG